MTAGPGRDHGGRGLPRLFHIGTQRAGSAFLFNLLRGHPAVALCPDQEVHYYTARHDRGAAWYRRVFPGDGEPVDTSPKYFQMGAIAAPRILEAVGERDPRFVLLLRNPIDYAESHFQLQRATGYLEEEPRYPEVPGDFMEFVDRYPAYLERARYAALWSEHWLPRFGRHQFHVVPFERFIRDTDRELAGILRFWGLPDAPLEAAPASRNRRLRHPALRGARRYVTSRPRLRESLKGSRAFNWLYETVLTRAPEPLAPERRSRLAGTLADDVAHLRTLLDDPIPEWADFPP